MKTTTRRSLHPSGRWQRNPDDTRNDAALLLPPVRGALTPDDPRTLRHPARHRATPWSRTATSTGSPNPNDPSAKTKEPSSCAGSSWPWPNGTKAEQTQAIHYFERARAACGPAALYAEEFDVQQRQLRGNLPQAFVHAALLETAQRLPGRLVPRVAI